MIASKADGPITLEILDDLENLTRVWAPVDIIAQKDELVPSREWWKLVGVVSGLLNPNDSSVGALERRPRHDQGYHEDGGCRRRPFTFR
jgi:hypothetical protein